MQQLTFKVVKSSQSLKKILTSLKEKCLQTPSTVVKVTQIKILIKYFNILLSPNRYQSLRLLNLQSSSFILVI